jgi:hypothetical protein
VTIYLAAADAGDGNEHDFAVWQQPRLVAPGRPDLLLRDVRAISAELTERRARIFAVTAKSLTAAAEASAASGAVDVPELARKYGVDADALAAWLGYLGIGSQGPARIDSYFTTKIGTPRMTSSRAGVAMPLLRLLRIPPINTCACPAT